MVGVVVGLSTLQVAAGVTAIAAVGSYQSSKKAAAAQQEQAQLAQESLGIEKQQAEATNIRSVRQQVRSARAARAAIINQAAGGGVSASSGAIGGAGAVGTALAGELDYFGQARQLQEQDFGLQQQYGAASARIGQAQATSAQWGAIGGLSGTVFEAKGGYKKLFE